MSKRTDAPYRTGPSKTWLTSKNPASDAVAGTAKRTGGRVVRAFKAVKPGREFKRCTRLKGPYDKRPVTSASLPGTPLGSGAGRCMTQRCGLAVVRHPEKDEHALVVAVPMDRRTNFAPPLTPRLRGGSSRDRAEGEGMSVAYCDISHWLLFSSLVLTIVALVLTLRDSAKASIICLGFVLLQVVVASLAFCPSIR